MEARRELEVLLNEKPENSALLQDLAMITTSLGDKRPP